jgi:hypothetical protein
MRPNAKTFCEEWLYENLGAVRSEPASARVIAKRLIAASVAAGIPEHEMNDDFGSVVEAVVTAMHERGSVET